MLLLSLLRLHYLGWTMRLQKLILRNVVQRVTEYESIEAARAWVSVQTDWNLAVFGALYIVKEARKLWLMFDKEMSFKTLQGYARLSSLSHDIGLTNASEDCIFLIISEIHYEDHIAFALFSFATCKKVDLCDQNYLIPDGKVKKFLLLFFQKISNYSKRKARD